MKLTTTLLASAVVGILFSTIAQADILRPPVSVIKTQKTLICTNSDVSGLKPELKIETVIIEDTRALDQSPEVEVIRVSKRNSEDEEFKTFATKKSITVDGTYAEGNLSIRAAGKMTKTVDDCYRKGTEFHIVQKGAIGGRGRPVILASVRELPRIIRLTDKPQKCLIARPMVPPAYNVSCTISAE